MIMTQSSLPNESKENEMFMKAKSSSLTTRIIKEGDSLSALVKSIFGSTNPEFVSQVLKLNPHISNARKIYPGQKIVFPSNAIIEKSGEATAGNPS